MKHLGYNAGNALKHYFKTHPDYVPADDPAIDNQDMMFLIGATQQASQCEEQDCDGWAILLAGTFTAMQDLASELIPGSPQSQYGHDSADPDCPGCGYQDPLLNSPNVESTLERIENNGPYPYKQDNTIFRNDERLLPVQDDPHYYREYTVADPGATYRGIERIVTGRNGEIYYTPNHYKTFYQIR